MLKVTRAKLGATFIKSSQQWTHSKSTVNRRTQPPINASNIELMTICEGRKHLLGECYLKVLTGEPVNSLVGYDTVTDREEYLRVFNEKVFRSDSPQLAAWDHTTKKVAGMQLTKLHKSDNKHTMREEHYLENCNLQQSLRHRSKIADDFFTVMEDKFSRPQLHNVDRTVYLNSLVVDKDYRSQGLATELVRSAVKQCQLSLGVSVFISTCTSLQSLNILKSVGFEELHVETYEGKYEAFNWMSREMQKKYDRLWVVMKRLVTDTEI